MNEGCAIIRHALLNLRCVPDLCAMSQGYVLACRQMAVLIVPCLTVVTWSDRLPPTMLLYTDSHGRGDEHGASHKGPEGAWGALLIGRLSHPGQVMDFEIPGP
jgi:hypothetical protein